MVFPEKPDFFDLNELECRLFAPRIAFQKLLQTPGGRQLKIQGNIVNVPADVTQTVSTLPRLQSPTATIKVNLKRELHYRSSTLSLNVRPHKVVEAAKWLVSNTTLYRVEGIAFDNDCINKYCLESIQDETDYNDDILQSNQDEKHVSCNETSPKLDNKHELSEGEEVTDTLFTATDFGTAKYP